MGVEYRIAAITIANNLRRMGVKELLCHRCGERISAGDWIHRTGSNRKIRRVDPGGARFYHLRCWEEMFVSV